MNPAPSSTSRISPNSPFGYSRPHHRIPTLIRTFTPYFEDKSQTLVLMPSICTCPSRLKLRSTRLLRKRQNNSLGRYWMTP